MYFFAFVGCKVWYPAVGARLCAFDKRQPGTKGLPLPKHRIILWSFVLLKKNHVFEMVKLSLFLNGLLEDGNVVVPRTMTAFESADLEAAGKLLLTLYEQDSLEMPYDCPGFHREAALWASGYIFRVCQLILLRDVNETELMDWLKGFDGLQTAEVVYSADLLLRFLPDLFRLGSGLSPEDPLLAHLKLVAGQWPFSSVGIEKIKVSAGDVIWQHPSLKYAYIDRIIQRKDLQRLKGDHERELLKETLGAHQQALWPGLELVLAENNHG